MQLGLHSKIEIDLSQIMSIVDVRDGLYSDDLCAVLVELKDPKVKSHYNDSRYLLQVWERTRGKLYEKTLKYQPIGWEICSSFFYMKLDPRDDANQYWFYEVSLGSTIRESKLRDFQENIPFKYFSSMGNWLYYGSQNEIYVLQANEQVAKNGLNLKTLSESKIQYGYVKIPDCWVFHGFLCGKALMEDADNNLFFCEVSLDATKKPIKLRFFEALSQVSRNDPDRIVKVLTYSRDVNNLYAVVLKESKAVEFYYNGIKLFNSATLEDKDGSIMKFQDIGITAENVYLRTEDATFRMSFEGKTRLLFTQAKQVKKINAGNWNRILQERVRHERIELFFDFKLNNTNLYVTYDRFNSSFDLMSGKKNFVSETALIGQEAQYLLGTNKDGDTVGLFQEASDPSQSKITASKVLYMNSNKGLVSNQQLPGRIVSKAEFNHFVSGKGDNTQHASYFITEDDKKSRALYTLWPGLDLAPSNIGGKIKFTGTNNETLINVYSPNKHYKDIYSYFGITNKVTREVKIYRHSDVAQYQDFMTIHLTQMVEDAFDKLHTIVIPRFTDKSLILFTQSAIFSFIIKTGLVEQKYQSFNLSPYNIQVVNCKYLYFQNLEGICVLNLKTIVSQSQSQEILLQKTCNSTNQVQYDPRFDRLLYFSDFETVQIVSMPHKNIVIPFGYNQLTGKVDAEQIETCFVTPCADNDLLSLQRTPEQKRLMAITKSQNIISWQYPTGQYIEKTDNLLRDILNKTDLFFNNTNLHNREHGKRFLLYAQPVKEEEKKGENPQRGQLHEFKIIRFTNSAQVSILKIFKFHIMPNDLLHFDINLNHFVHFQIDHGISRSAGVFKLQPVPGDAKQCTTKFTSQIAKLQWELFQISKETNSLFSPNLIHYLSFDTKFQCFVVNRVDLGQQQKGQQMIILEGLINVNDSEFDLMEISSNFKWETDYSFRMVNKQGFEKYVSIADNKWIIKDSTVVPMKNLLNENQKSLYYFEKFNNKIRSTFDRLLRSYQKTFTNRQLGITARNSSNDTEYVLQNSKSKFYITQNYSMFHFKMCQSLIKINQASVAERLGEDDIKGLLLNVFPGNNLFLHKAFENKTDENQLNFKGVTLKALFAKLYDNRKDEQKFFFPLISNDLGLTPFDLCLPGNLKSADILLKYLKHQPPGSHSEDIIKSLPLLIASGLPSLGDYLDSRICQTRVHTKISTMQGFEPIDNKDYMLQSSHLAPDYESFQKQFEKKHTKRVCCFDIVIEPKDFMHQTEVKVEVLDLPFIHSYNGEGYTHAKGLFRQLSTTENLDIFNSKAIQYLIDYNWDKTKIFTINFLFVPFLFYQAAFIAYSNVYNGQSDNPAASFEYGYLALSAVLLGFSLYFIINEVGQLTQVGLAYFGSGFVWNAIDLFPPCFIIAVVVSRLRQDYEFDELMKPGFIDTVHAVACLLMWLKFLYFLRLFESTNHLVRVVMNIIWEMKSFIAILFIMYMAFGEAFLRLSEKSPLDSNGKPFLGNFAEAFIYCVRLGAGDTDVQEIYDLIQPITGWILFVVFETLTCILMMSLLVTLIMKQYDTISKNATLSNYQQKADLIFENSYLTQLCRCFGCRNYEIERNLMIITDISNQGLEISKTYSKDPMSIMQLTIKKLVSENGQLRRTMEQQSELTNEKIDFIVNQLKDKVKV